MFGVIIEVETYSLGIKVNPAEWLFNGNKYSDNYWVTIIKGKKKHKIERI